MRLSRAWRLFPAVMAGALWASQPWATRALAAEFRLANTVGTSATVTDNRDLTTSDQAESALIFGATGTTALRAEGNRANMAADIGLSLLKSFPSEDNLDLRQDIIGLGTAELLSEMLFVDGRASSRQVLTDQTGGVSLNPFADTAGRTSVHTATISPYLRNRFGGWAESEARVTHSTIWAGGDIGTTNVDGARLEVQTGNNFGRLRLGGLLEQQITEAEERGADLDRQTALLSAAYALIRGFAVTGTYGYESIDTESLTEDPEGQVWSAGFIATPGPNTELSLSYGSRYGRMVWNGSLRYRLSPQLTVRANYREGVETTQERLLSPDMGLDAASGEIIDLRTGLPVPADEGLGLFTLVYRVARFDLSVIGSYERNTLTLSLSDQKRDFDLRPDDRSRLFTARLSRLLEQNLTGGVQATWQDVRRDTQPDFQTALGRVDLERRLNPDLAVGAALTHGRRFADLAGLEYRESTATVFVRLGL